jgi:hypothetical protein
LKKLILVGCVTSIVVAAGNARAAQWYVGVMGGVNFADISGVDEASARTCFSGGAFVEVDVSDQFGGRVEVLYTQKGANQDTNPEFGDEDTSLHLSYVEIPVVFVLSLNKTETSDFSVFGGPTFGFNTGAEIDPETSNIVDISDDVEDTEFGAVVGIEFEHIRTSGIFFGDLRFSIGATEIIEDAASGLAEAKNRGFAILVGFKFPLGGQN